MPLQTGTWAGHTTYLCPHCAFDSLHESEVHEHIDLRHRFLQPPVASGPAPALYDGRGNLIPARESAKRYDG